MNDEPLWNLDHLALSYKNIIEIDNLEGLNKLTMLQLDNNIICKIHNIDHLVNLQWLDLSFNLISKVEGLDTLVNLTDLSLYNNKIEELEGLEKLHKLNVLSVGKNLLWNHENVIRYLMTLNNNLEVLKLADNKFGKNGVGELDYKLFAIEMLKKPLLKYLDYEPITADQRNDAKQKHTDEASKDTGDAINKEDDVKAVDQELIDAKIDSTHKLIEKIQEESEDA